MTAHLEYIIRPDDKGFAEHTFIDGKTINKENVIPCAKLIEKCDVEYPRFPCWQACGYSYIEANGLIACKNSEMVKRLLSLDIKPN